MDCHCLLLIILHYEICFNLGERLCCICMRRWGLVVALFPNYIFRLDGENSSFTDSFLGSVWFWCKFSALRLETIGKLIA